MGSQTSISELQTSNQIIIPCKTSRVIQRFSQPCDEKSPINRRARSPFFNLAKTELEHVMDLGVDSMDLRLVELHFQHWLEHYHNRFVHLSNGEREIFLKSINRFTEDYRRSLKARMHRLKDIDWAIKIEITLDPKRFMGLYDEFVYLPKLWNTINRWLERTYGDHEFLRIMEITKKGRPHLHILLAFHDPKWQKYFRSMSRRDKNKRFQAFYGELKDVSERNNGGFVWVKPIHGEIRIVNYVMKYVNKSINFEGITKEDVQNHVYGALLFATNRRLFSVSHGLRAFSKPKNESQGFSYLGSVPSSELKSFCVERDIPFGFSVSFDSDLVDPYRFPLLFGFYDVEKHEIFNDGG